MNHELYKPHIEITRILGWNFEVRVSAAYKYGPLQTPILKPPTSTGKKTQIAAHYKSRLRLDNVLQRRLTNGRAKKKLSAQTNERGAGGGEQAP